MGGLGSGGRNRKPARIKALAGTVKPSRERAPEVPAGRVGLHPPLWLRPIAAAKWQEMARSFARRETLHPVVVDLLANYT